MSDPSGFPTTLSGRPEKEFSSMTGREHAEKFGDDRVTLLEVVKVTKPMKKFTEDDWYFLRENAISISEPPTERRRREQQSARDQRAQRRTEGKPAEQNEGVRRSGRHQGGKVAYAESDPKDQSSDNPSSEDSEDEFVASPESEEVAPSSRGVKRKRAVTFKATDEKVTELPVRSRQEVSADSHDMAEASASRSRSVTPVPPVKKRRTRRTILSDSDDEMAEPSESRSRSVTPAPPIKKHSKRRTTLSDSDDEMAEPSVSRSRSVTPLPAVKTRKVEGKRKVTLNDSDDEME
ncbi:unnamed protein product [Aureobasidium mustum]|uniref:Uncharacterized protein n=1 Tax=Aureobasidium mustum TaxID=2773714 RepID=A0A9N8K8N2_9PEZI|nr:unnamed protein product [Aureobasidium mustum]